MSSTSTVCPLLVGLKAPGDVWIIDPYKSSAPIEIRVEPVTELVERLLVDDILNLDRECDLRRGAVSPDTINLTVTLTPARSLGRGVRAPLEVAEPVQLVVELHLAAPRWTSSSARLTTQNEQVSEPSISATRPSR